MKRLRLLAASALIALSLAGCGGGGEGATGSTNGDTNTTTDTVISGMATKGPITGTLSIYALSSGGSKGNLLKSAPITDGVYTANIGKYAGPVLIEVYGSYTDEATGKTLSIAADAPLRAALPNASENVSTAVTPLTELAVQKAGPLTPAAIEAGNKLVSDIFMFDIVNTLPVAPTAAAVSLASQSQKDYTLAIAALSQLSKTLNQSLTNTIASLAAGISSSGMNSLTTANFQNAVQTFIVINPNNNTGVKDLSATNLSAVNGTITTSASFTLTIQGTAAADAIRGLQFEVVVPNELTVSSDASGTPLPRAVSLSALTVASEPTVVQTFSTASNVLAFGLITNSGIGPGGLATITCDLLPGWTLPSAAAFSVRNVKAVDANAATISGISVTVN